MEQKVADRSFGRPARKGAGDWRIGCGMIMGWDALAAGILEPDPLEHWNRFAEAKPFWG